ncbi:subunit 17 of mediator complex-domain-containing protein [Mycena floridula]|nr:subunit 17 of mediator complex-domain-containing protein [Mycena floridula]
MQDLSDSSATQTRLSLERPYADENGNPIPILLDITAEGEHTYETKESPAKLLGENLRRIFIERGHDFFDRNNGHILENGVLIASESAQPDDDTDSDEDEEDKEEGSGGMMNTDDLYKMRMEIMPQLYTSLGEMTHARELLSLILSSAPNPQPPSSESVPLLSATSVTKPPPIPSVQAFNAQLTIGGKDEALRKAADVFKSAAQSMERGRTRSEKYWVDALKIRRGNWGLVPAPLPFGAPTGKGADKTSKDFLVSYGLEEALPAFRRQAVGRMTSKDDALDALEFPYRQRTRLRVSVTSIDLSGERIGCQHTIQIHDESTIDGSLKSAQQEIVEREIFSLLVREAGNLPTVSARVSERLIVIDAAQGTEVKFELVDSDQTSLSSPSQPLLQAKCDIIYHVLHALLLRRHLFLKSQRLAGGGTLRPDLLPPLVLQPIIDLLQYEVFCERVHFELDSVLRALKKASVPCALRFNAVGEAGKELVAFFVEINRRPMGGEAVLRIDDRHTVRLTFVSPSSLTAHLSQATLTISSIPQLRQLLADEVERYLLQRICELGLQLCSGVGGIWFVDLNRCVGRWEGSVLNFRISYEKDGSINCSAFCLGRHTQKQGELELYTTGATVPLFSWVEQTIQKSFATK